MATARSSQSHQKRVQQIATEAAEKIAAEAPLEEDVLVVIEELPPGELERTGSGRSTSRPKNQDAPREVAAQGQQLIAGDPRVPEGVRAEGGRRDHPVQGSMRPEAPARGHVGCGARVVVNVGLLP